MYNERINSYKPSNLSIKGYELSKIRTSQPPALDIPRCTSTSSKLELTLIKKQF